MSSVSANTSQVSYSPAYTYHICVAGAAFDYHPELQNAVSL